MTDLKRGDSVASATHGRLRLNRATALFVALELATIVLGAWLVINVPFASLGDHFVPPFLRSMWNVDYSAILVSEHGELASAASSMRKYLWWSTLLACVLNALIVGGYQVHVFRWPAGTSTRHPSGNIGSAVFFSVIGLLSGYGVFLNEDILDVRGRGLPLGNAQDGLWWLYMPLSAVVLVLSTLYAMTIFFGYVLRRSHYRTLRAR